MVLGWIGRDAIEVAAGLVLIFVGFGVFSFLTFAGFAGFAAFGALVFTAFGFAAFGVALLVALTGKAGGGITMFVWPGVGDTLHCQTPSATIQTWPSLAV